MFFLPNSTFELRNSCFTVNYYFSLAFYFFYIIDHTENPTPMVFKKDPNILKATATPLRLN
jgi:hypothetical protein